MLLLSFSLSSKWPLLVLFLTTFCSSLIDPHPLPVPRVAHAFAESCLLYKLVKLKNELATYHKLIHAKIIELTHSHSGFSNYVVNIMIDRYSYECILYPCWTCSRT